MMRSCAYEFEFDDLRHIDVQQRDADKLQQILDNETTLKAALENGHGRTVWTADGRPIAAFGVMDVSGTHGVGWAILGRDLRRHMVYVDREARRVLAEYVEGTNLPVLAEAKWDKAVTWLLLLGFSDANGGWWIYS